MTSFRPHKFKMVDEAGREITRLAASGLLATLVPLVNDLASDMPDGERYRRLLQAVRRLLPCDAAALLQLDAGYLVPLAVNGLSTDTLGRRFKIDEHPRFAALLDRSGPTRFPSDSPLPDPYDGLVDGRVEGHELNLHVHDCMGCPVQVQGRVWGLITIDAIDPDSFSHVDLNDLQAFASLAAATVSVASRIQGLATQAEDERRRADSWREVVGRAKAPALIGTSEAAERLMRDIDAVADSDLTVLVTGETGVGKELVAMALHAGSPRAAKPLVSINCAALPETLVESELFGHVRGAFSGAVSDRRGKFEMADGGTLFLDEVGELPLPVQAKLLRVLQNGQIQRIGSDRQLEVNVRVIAATNRDLAQEVRAGRYRADFYHRLSVYPLGVPPLRVRGHDVLLLAGGFLEENRSRLRLGGLRLDADAKAALLAYSWPGNVRELEHLIGRSSLKAYAAEKASSTSSKQSAGGRRSGQDHMQAPRQGTGLTRDSSAVPAHRVTSRIVTIKLEHLDVGIRDEVMDGGPDEAMPSGGRSPRIRSRTLKDSIDDHQRQRILKALEDHRNNWASAARELGVHRANLVRLARRLELKF